MRPEAPWAIYRLAEGGGSTGIQHRVHERIVTGEKTVAELSRELDISPSLIRN